MKHLPNLITCLNLLSGCIGVVFAFDGALKYAGFAILVAALLDFFDGMVARLFNAYSPMGKELDSLADMVSFGFLPAVILFQLFEQSPTDLWGISWLPYTAFLLAIFSALRLAKFNIDTRQAEHFIGLPTPSAALIVLSIPFIMDRSYGAVSQWIQLPAVLLTITCLLSFLLVAELPLLSLKFKSFGFKENIFRYILLLSGLIWIVFLNFAAIPLIMGTYIILSIIQFNKKTGIASGKPGNSNH